MKSFDEAFKAKPFTLAASHVFVTESLLPPNDLKNYIDKSHTEITESAWLHYKQSESLEAELRAGLSKFEALGDAQKASAKHLTDLIAKHEAARLLAEPN